MLYRTKIKQILLISIGLVFTGNLFAETASSDEIKAIFNKTSPELHVFSIADTALNGVYEVALSSGKVAYAFDDGEHFLLGELNKFNKGGVGYANLTKQKFKEIRKSELTKLDDKDMIVFSPEGKKKATITVFTDVDCSYCRKLHNEVPQLNGYGIEVRYMAYPRAGIGSKTYNIMQSAWCAEDQQDALTKAKAGQQIPEKKCENPIAEQYSMGKKFGVRGTPNIILTDGEIIPGYRPAQNLAAQLFPGEVEPIKRPTNIRPRPRPRPTLPDAKNPPQKRPVSNPPPRKRPTGN